MGMTILLDACLNALIDEGYVITLHKASVLPEDKFELTMTLATPGWKTVAECSGRNLATMLIDLTGEAGNYLNNR